MRRRQVPATDTCMYRVITILSAGVTNTAAAIGLGRLAGARCGWRHDTTGTVITPATGANASHTDSSVSGVGCFPSTSLTPYSDATAAATRTLPERSIRLGSRANAAITLPENSGLS